VTTVSPQASPLERAICFFETLSPADLGRVDEIYAPQAWFKDPFNEVQGPIAIAAIFAHMFEVLDKPHFVVRERIGGDAQAFVTWDFRFAFKRGSPAGIQTIRGASHLQFDAGGRIMMHRDYWDAAEELYEKLPLLGSLMRWLRRKLATPAI
jgi:steroid delta-isomerase